MYDWVTHMWSPITGCPHQCEYCYVKAYGNLPYKPELKTPFPALGSGKTIFVGHLCDMFAEGVTALMIREVLQHCNRYSNNEFVFQSKNPQRMLNYWNFFPEQTTFGTTIETNRQELLSTISQAPPVGKRALWFGRFPPTGKKFVTIEPILAFDLLDLLHLIKIARPCWVNIGADSKRHDLPEPTKEDVEDLIKGLSLLEIPILKKMNLERLMVRSNDLVPPN